MNVLWMQRNVRGSSCQKRIWIHCQWNPCNPSWGQPARWTQHGPTRCEAQAERTQTGAATPNTPGAIPPEHTQTKIDVIVKYVLVSIYMCFTGTICWPIVRENAMGGCSEMGVGSRAGGGGGGGGGEGVMIRRSRSRKSLSVEQRKN